MSDEREKIKYLNVVMHGAFSYFLNRDELFLRAVTPAVRPHVYMARNYGATEPDPPHTPIEFPLVGDYELRGVRKAAKFSVTPGTPCLPAKQSSIQGCDVFGKRRFRVDLPFPTGDGEHHRAYHLLEPFSIGSVFQGTAAQPLNDQGGAYPSLFCFVYTVNPNEQLALVPREDQPALRASERPPQTIPLDFLILRHHHVNLHIIGGLDPANGMPNMTDHTAHARRAFASLVDLFDQLPLTLDIPDGFTPQKLPYHAPTGLTMADIERDNKRMSIEYGQGVSNDTNTLHTINRVFGCRSDRQLWAGNSPAGFQTNHSRI